MKRRKYRKFENLDADGSIFFETELESMKAQSYDIQYPELLARSLFPVDSSADPGAETISYQTWDNIGMAKLIHSYAMDLPNIEVTATKTSRQIYGQGVAFSYSIQDIRNARMANKPLDVRKVNAARRQMLYLEDKIAWFGNTAAGVPGADIPSFVNNANTTSVTIPDGASTDTRWSTKTPDEIINDIGLMASTIRSSTNSVESPSRLLLPEIQYGLIATKRLTDSATTILDFVLRTNPWVNEIIPAYPLAGAAPASGSYDSQDCMILYDPNPEKLTLEIPQDVEYFPAQEKGLMYEVPVHERTAGVIMYYPKSVAQGNGI